MKHSRLLISGSILLASWMNSGIAFSQTSGESNERIHPDLNQSEGGSKSERDRSGVPLPKGDPSSGTVDKGKSGSTDAVTPRSSETRRETGKKSDSDTTEGKDTDQPNQTEPRTGRQNGTVPG
jgi:hypothetical protein